MTYRRYYIQLGCFGNVGLGSVFAVTADNLGDAIEEAIALAADVAPGLLTSREDATFCEFPEDFVECEQGIIGSSEVSVLCDVDADRGAGKFDREPLYMPNNYRFAALLEAVAQ